MADNCFDLNFVEILFFVNLQLCTITFFSSISKGPEPPPNWNWERYATDVYSVGRLNANSSTLHFELVDSKHGQIIEHLACVGKGWGNFPWIFWLMLWILLAFFLKSIFETCFQDSVQFVEVWHVFVVFANRKKEGCNWSMPGWGGCDEDGEDILDTIPGLIALQRVVICHAWGCRTAQVWIYQQSTWKLCILNPSHENTKRISDIL